MDLASGELHSSGQALRLDGAYADLARRPAGARHLARLVHPDDRAPMLARLQRAVDSGESRYEHEVRVPLADGSVRWINSYITVHRDAAGRATQLSGAAIDVTPMRARARRRPRAEAQLRIISDSLPVLIAYATPDRRYRFNNKAYETWFGASPESLAGSTWPKCSGSAPMPTSRPHLDRAYAGETTRFRSRLEYSSSGRATSPAPTCRTWSTARCAAS